MLDRCGEEGVGNAGEGTRGVELAIRKCWVQVGVCPGIAFFEFSTGVMEGTELNGDLNGELNGMEKVRDIESLGRRHLVTSPSPYRLRGLQH